MGIKKITFAIGVSFLLLLFYGCPESIDECNDMSSQATIPNLITITPFQETYNQGDEITFSISIDAVNSYFGGLEQNIFQITGEHEALLMLGADQLFTDNELTYIVGIQGEYANWFYMPYNSVNGKYELELKVKLNKTGQYSFYTSDDIDIVGEGCNRFRLSTNIEGMNSEDKIAFEVLQ